MEKEQASHHGIFIFLCQISEDVLHLSEIRHCSWDFKRSIVLLELEAVSGSRNKYDTASFHILSFGQEGIPEGYH